MAVYCYMTDGRANAYRMEVAQKLAAAALTLWIVIGRIFDHVLIIRRPRVPEVAVELFVVRHV